MIKHLCVSSTRGKKIKFIFTVPPLLMRSLAVLYCLQKNEGNTSAACSSIFARLLLLFNSFSESSSLSSLEFLDVLFFFFGEAFFNAGLCFEVFLGFFSVYDSLRRWIMLTSNSPHSALRNLFVTCMGNS